MEKQNKFYKHKIENLINISKIITIHYFEFKKYFKFAGERHDFWEMVYADKESVDIIKDTEHLTLKAGDIIFHKPLEFHAISSSNKCAPNVFVITFECKSASMSFFENRRLTLPQNFKHYIASIIAEAKNTFKLPIFDLNLKRLELLPSPNLGGGQFIKNNLELLLISIMRAETLKVNTKDFFYSQDDFVNSIQQKITTLLKANIYNKLSLTQICDALSYGKTVVCTTFKNKSGYSIMDYYNRLKIDEGKRLLREEELNIRQISDKLGYSAPDYFTKTFKHFTNLTPSQYINSIKN